MATEQKEVMTAAVASVAAEAEAAKGTHDFVFTSFSLVTDKFDEGIKAAHAACVRELERLDVIRLREDELMWSMDERIQDADAELVALRESAASILATLDGIAANATTLPSLQPRLSPHCKRDLSLTASATLPSLQASRQQQQPSFFSLANPVHALQLTPSTDKSSFFKQQEQEQEQEQEQQPTNMTQEQDKHSEDKGKDQAQGHEDTQNGGGPHSWEEEEGLGEDTQQPKRSKRARRRNVTIHGPE